MCVLMEVCTGGDINKLYSSCTTHNPISTPLQWRLAYESAQAINALHTLPKPTMHRDIKGMCCAVQTGERGFSSGLEWGVNCLNVNVTGCCPLWLSKHGIRLDFPGVVFRGCRAQGVVHDRGCGSLHPSNWYRCVHHILLG